ncbi:hypothetical protein PGT21_028943 [Puccinia graminis f. sp. tritici]|uniref:Uncharacterized protein n=1 Tax=Puccinia graminis f. sp. tritici TaxID=56615 RepID=A0A5B0RSJ1_PUCGR|nr:hypothetical protein PGT21_027906 [Puccinia graminis f. sp. tritici]KAA1108914.1 hypothetical protein PGT21_028943 [Puccinia graminis f. sp. tritici]KAA1122424.1 hypothetical protein PGTUg99_037555 [Puccinia graminis f. sp. tritici]KAA1128921.1 hypothetical protein PGTUg99_003807 [Puccinia graminis f. sp. tritici]
MNLKFLTSLAISFAIASSIVGDAEMDCPTDKARCVDDMNQSSIPATPDGPADQHHFHCSNGYTIVCDK